MNERNGELKSTLVCIFGTQCEMCTVSTSSNQIDARIYLVFFFCSYISVGIVSNATVNCRVILVFVLLLNSYDDHQFRIQYISMHFVYT